MNKHYSILVVDDEKLVRDMITDFLEKDYAVSTAENAEEALKLPGLGDFRLVISDINMPGMPGFEFLKKVKTLHPSIKTVLITAYNVDDYIRLAKEHGIANIISKTVPFNFGEMSSVIRSLVDEDIFGIEKYMRPDAQIIKEYIVKGSADAKWIRDDILKIFASHIQDTGELRLVMDELVTNALYHSVRDGAGRDKYKEFANISLRENEYIFIRCGLDSEKYGVSITDNQGTLTKDIVLYKLDRHIRGEGVLDDDGRGLFMSRIFADRLIVNIAPMKKTEIVIFNYRDKRYKGFKPLYINEL
jgi:YesN/AraC family two-component response regulator